MELSKSQLPLKRIARELGKKAKRAVEEGGSSYMDADALIQELKSLLKSESFMA